jgi:hypothetical protein
MRSAIDHLAGPEIYYRLLLLEGSKTAHSVARLLPAPVGVWPELRLTAEWVGAAEMLAAEWERQPDAPASVALETIVGGEMGCVFVETDLFVIAERLATLRAARPAQPVRVRRAGVSDWLGVGRVIVAVAGALFVAGFTLGVYIGQSRWIDRRLPEAEPLEGAKEIREAVAGLRQDVAEIKGMLQHSRSVH